MDSRKLELKLGSDSVDVKVLEEIFGCTFLGTKKETLNYKKGMKICIIGKLGIQFTLTLFDQYDQ